MSSTSRDDAAASFGACWCDVGEAPGNMAPAAASTCRAKQRPDALHRVIVPPTAVEWKGRLNLICKAWRRVSAQPSMHPDSPGLGKCNRSLNPAASLFGTQHRCSTGAPAPACRHGRPPPRLAGSRPSHRPPPPAHRLHAATSTTSQQSMEPHAMQAGGSPIPSLDWGSLGSTQAWQGLVGLRRRTHARSSNDTIILDPLHTAGEMPAAAAKFTCNQRGTQTMPIARPQHAHVAMQQHGPWQQ